LLVLHANGVGRDYSMSQHQSITVYTNPYQRDFYESGMLIPLMGGLGTGFIVFILLMWLAERILGNRRVNDLVMVGAGAAALCAGALTFHWLFI